MFISHGIWFLRTRGIRTRAKEAEVDYDEFPEAKEWQGKAIKLRFSRKRGQESENISEQV
jgi:hypothetical protein